MINCGHSRYMFVPGLSKKREMDFTKKENDEAYVEKQRQRQYERAIRNKKREIAMLKQTGAEPTYIKIKQNSLSNTKKEYLSFLDKTGRTRITANEWIGSTELSPKVKEKSTKTYQNWKNKKEKKENLLKEAKKVYNNVTDEVALNGYKQLLLRNNKIKENPNLIKINEDKQLKHNINSEKYIQGKSYFNIDIKEEQKLVNEYATKGYTPLTIKGNIQNKEICSTNKVIGVYINKNYNVEEETNSFVIHYSEKNGVHIVPASNNAQFKNIRGDDNDK